VDSLSAADSAVALLAVERDTDVTDVLPVISVPTLVLHRTEDRANDINEGRRVADGIPDV
jgi:pimeloyl-ACP methyl ester carboxylesterase